MQELRAAFEASGVQNVKTILASGNVLFDTAKKERRVLTQTIEEQLKNSFGQEIGVVLRTMEEMQKIVSSNPFKNITLTPDMRWYVSFLPEKSACKIKIPY